MQLSISLRLLGELILALTSKVLPKHQPTACKLHVVGLGVANRACLRSGAVVASDAVRSSDERPGVLGPLRTAPAIALTFQVSRVTSLQQSLATVESFAGYNEDLARVKLLCVTIPQVPKLCQGPARRTKCTRCARSQMLKESDNYATQLSQTTKTPTCLLGKVLGAPWAVAALSAGRALDMLRPARLLRTLSLGQELPREDGSKQDASSEYGHQQRALAAMHDASSALSPPMPFQCGKLTIREQQVSDCTGCINQ